MGGVVNTISDIVGGAGDVVGDVIGGAGDIVGTALDNPLETAAVIAAIAAGQPEFLGLDAAGADAAAAAAADTFGSSTAADIAANEAAAAAAAGAAGAGGITDIPFDGPTIPTDVPFDGPTIPNSSGYNPPIDSFDGPTIPNSNGYNPPIDSFDGPTLPTTPNVPIKTITDIVKQGLNLGQNAGSATGANPNNFDWQSFLSNVGGVAPLAAAGGLGYLAYQNQADINKTIMDAYNNYLNKQNLYTSGYGVGTGPQQLNYTVGGVPLAQAQPRTVAQTVVKPKAATGGSINDLFNEYAMLNNRMRNYRRLARGGLI